MRLAAGYRGLAEVAPVDLAGAVVRRDRPALVGAGLPVVASEGVGAALEEAVVVVWPVEESLAGVELAAEAWLFLQAGRRRRLALVSPPHARHWWPRQRR